MKPDFKSALKFWLKLGFISFGGPSGQIAIMHKYLVEDKKWISNSRFSHALNYCMLLPGPEAQQLATYLGWLFNGLRGALLAGILFILPSVAILLALSIAYVTYGNVPVVSLFFDGIKPAILAVIIHAIYKMGKKSLVSSIHFATALLSFFSIFFLNIPFYIVVIFSLIVGLVYKKSTNITPKQTQDSAIEEEKYLINANQQSIHQLSIKKVLLQIGVGLILWILPLILVILFLDDPNFYFQLIFFFTSAAFVTFGGAYAVLPYVAQVSVEKFGWLSKGEMVDGMALGESTPGPLIMILAYVGFIAGFHHFDQSIFKGTISLLLTTWYTFLPSFLFILIGAPFIEQTRNSLKIKTALSMVTAAICGVMLQLAIYLGQSILIVENTFNYLSLIITLTSLFILIKTKIPIGWWILICGISYCGINYFLK